MALATTSKINIIGHQKDQEEILEALQNLGFTQLEDFKGDDLEKTNLNEKITEIDYKLAGIRFSLEFLARYETEKKSLDEKISKIQLSLSEIEKHVKDSNLDEQIEAIQALESGINEAQSTKDKLNLELTQIETWKNLEFSPSKTADSAFDFKFISVLENLYHDLINQLEKDLPLSALEKVNETGGKKKEILAVVFFQKADEEKINEILARQNIKVIDLPEIDKNIPERIKEINQEIEQADSRGEKLKKEAQRLALNQKDLEIAFDYYTWQKEKLVNQQKCGNTWQTFSIIGWIDRELIPILKKALSKITDDFDVEELPIGEEELVPVIFKNKIAKDFESITSLYGTPQTHDPDPTPFLAPFFILFFGMAMTDAGYGAIMALGIYAAIKFLKIPRSKQKLLRVLMWGGVATFILGALTGGWFSIELNILPAVIQKPLKAIQIINPIENPLLIFYISLGLGLLQVSLGLAINTYWKIKSRQIMDGIFGSGAWLLTIIAGILFAAGSMNVLPTFVGQFGKWLIFLGIIMIVYGGSRGTKNIFLKPGFGLLGLYSVVGYFSDVLSYSRLLALGLTTTIIGTVVNIIAGLVFGIPYVGWLAALIILIGGHAFNLVINALGAFIHSARLQFIEFFPKFLEAGGLPFEPFGKQSKYVKIKN